MVELGWREGNGVGVGGEWCACGCGVCLCVRITGVVCCCLGSSQTLLKEDFAF